MAEESYHYCEADMCPSVAEDPRHHADGQVIFELQFQVTKVRKKIIEYYRGDDPLPTSFLPDECDPMVEKIFRIQESVLLKDNSAYTRDDNGVLTNNVSILSIILSSLDVSMDHQDNIIYDIHSMATSMVQNPNYASQVVLAMKVQLSIVTQIQNVIRLIGFVHTENIGVMLDNIDLDTNVARDVMNESFEDQPTDGLYRATTSSIEALERMIIEGIEDLESIGDCVICLDNFFIGMEVRKMPCLHIFHGNCIEKWLERSHLCPLCRFTMPYQLLK